DGDARRGGGAAPGCGAAGTRRHDPAHRRPGGFAGDRCRGPRTRADGGGERTRSRTRAMTRDEKKMTARTALRATPLTLVLLLAITTAAFAHTALRASSPEKGERLAASPSEIRLSFTSTVDPR